MLCDGAEMLDPLPGLSTFLIRRRVLVTAVILLLVGVVMNGLGHLLSIGWFKHWWQVVPCYLGYVLPLTLVLRGAASTSAAWRTSILAFIPLELIGYAIGSSVVGEGNLIAALVGEHNFTLVMVLLVSPTPLIGNFIADKVIGAMDRLGSPPSSMP